MTRSATGKPPTNWSSGSMPITPQDAYIGGVSGDMVVTLNANVQINSIATSADAEFAIGNNTPATVDRHRRHGPQRGGFLERRQRQSRQEFGVDAGSALQIGNTFDNAGTLAIGKGAGGSGNSGYLYHLRHFRRDDAGWRRHGRSRPTRGQRPKSVAGRHCQRAGHVGQRPHQRRRHDHRRRADQPRQLRQPGETAGSRRARPAASGCRSAPRPSATKAFITAETGSTLDLGADGDTETLTNTGNGTTSGAVNIDSDARLAISGNFTIAGTGAVSFKGAGAELTSDGAAATFTNDSTIGLDPSLDSSGAFSGQLGDQGCLAVNDLTYVNNGTTYASGSGGTR